MNIRTFSIVLMASALPILAGANNKISLNKGDFKSAQRISRNGKTILSVRLSKSGKAKLRKLKNSVGEPVHAEIAGVSTDFELKEPIKGDGLEMGPYSAENAEKVVGEINSQ